MHVENRTSERSLTVLVIVESLQLFLIAPLAAETRVPAWTFFFMIALNVAIVLSVVWHRRSAAIAVVVAALIETLAVALRVFSRSTQTEALDFVAALILLIALTIVVGMTIFGPGRVTVHRVVGAVAIYLNIALAFALAYRLISALSPTAFSAGLRSRR